MLTYKYVSDLNCFHNAADNVAMKMKFNLLQAYRPISKQKGQPDKHKT